MTIKDIRKHTGLSREEFCEEYGISEMHIEKWESGETECPKYITKILERKAIHGEADASFRYYDQSILNELGICYKKLLRLINEYGDNPYPQAKIFPLKYFMKLYRRALRAGIPKDLEERVGLLIATISYEDWFNPVLEPLPKNKQGTFMYGFFMG